MQVYGMVFRLCSPMHIGQAKLGNVQRTRPYVTGRVLWGAITQRLTRDNTVGPATDSRLYQAIGQRVDRALAFTYLYPTIFPNGSVDLWPWDYGFSARFLYTYVSTALAYPHHAAQEGALHEVECIVPRTLDGGQQVYLSGYLFVWNGDPAWTRALERLQLGGERGYGWGAVELSQDPRPLAREPLFGGQYAVERDTWPPMLQANQSARLVAHALAADVDAAHRAVVGVDGPVEPLVGREVDPRSGRFGVNVSAGRICYAPGANVKPGARLEIGPFGIWEACLGDPHQQPSGQAGVLT